MLNAIDGRSCDGIVWASVIWILWSFMTDCGVGIHLVDLLQICKGFEKTDKK